MMESESLKHQAQVKELELSVNIAQEQSEEAKIRNERLQSELSTLKQEYNNHINDQKAHSQKIQANCIELEDRIDAANREIMVCSFKLDCNKRPGENSQRTSDFATGI